MDFPLIATLAREDSSCQFHDETSWIGSQRVATIVCGLFDVLSIIETKLGITKFTRQEEITIHLYYIIIQLRKHSTNAYIIEHKTCLIV